MKEKIKVLSVITEKRRYRSCKLTMNDVIEKEVPDTYEFKVVFKRQNIIEQIEQYRPKIVFLPHDGLINTLELLRQIKQVHPSIVIFILLSEKLIEDEQKTISEFYNAGAYKCVYSTFAINSLIHDMHVSLNLEQ